MIRVLVVIAIVFAAVLGLDALGSVPVNVAVTWPGGEMVPPLRVVVVALAVFAVLSVLAWWIVSLVWRGPSSLSGWFRGRRRDRGYKALSRGMIAIGSGDMRLAHRHADEARRLLPAEPLVLLLEAQTAQLEGKSDEARRVFARMAETDDTKLLGLRGLFIEATRAGELEAARQFAAEAQRLSPGLPWAGTSVIENQSAEHDWAGALATLDQNAAARLIDKAEAKRLRAVLLTARALEVEDADPSAARNYALEAHRLAPDFVPAGVVAARVLTRLQDTRRATKVVEAIWKLNPHPELSDAYLHVRSGDSTHDRLKRARALLALRPNQIEGVLAVAQAALDAREFPLAREHLSRALRQSTTQRVCLLMADLEEAETGDPGRIREWLGRAVRAQRDEAWTADGMVSPVWLPVSPVTGRLDAFEWRVPVASDSGATELDGSDLAERAARPLEPPRPAIDPEEDDDPPGGTLVAPRTVTPPAEQMVVERAQAVSASNTADAAPAPQPEPPGVEDLKPADPPARPASFLSSLFGGARGVEAAGGSSAAADPDDVPKSQAGADVDTARGPIAFIPPTIRPAASGETHYAEDPIPFRPDDPAPPARDRMPQPLTTSKAASW